MRIVIDTNVFVVRLLSPVGAPARVFHLWESEAFELLVSEPILAEYARVLTYPHMATRLGLDSSAIADLIDTVRHFAIVIQPQTALPVIGLDPADDRFLECALAGEADYIVSGDQHFLQLREYHGIQVLPPAAFVALLDD